MQGEIIMGLFADFINDRIDKVNAISELGGRDEKEGKDKFKQLKNFFVNKVTSDYFEEPSSKAGFLRSLKSYRTIKRYITGFALLDAVSILGLGEKAYDILSSASNAVMFNDLAGIVLTLGMAGITTYTLPKLLKSYREAQDRVITYIKAQTHKGSEIKVRKVGVEYPINENSFNGIEMSTDTANIAARKAIAPIQRNLNDEINKVNEK